MTGRLDRLAFGTLRAHGYTLLELAPVAPLGTVSVLSPLDQNRVLTTGRGTELVADSTNVLALESAVRRAGRERVRLCASHRLLRTQPFPQGWSQHFRLLALTIAGRDEGSFRFETESLRDQLNAMLSLLTGLDDGISFADGGFTTWTRQLLGNAKERLLTGGLGVDTMHTIYAQPEIPTH
jgi:hypothetical protein